VCVLYEEGVEIPSDFHGVQYVQLDERSGWRYQVAQELRAARYGIDLNKI
jgi:hypothetical protein